MRIVIALFVAAVCSGALASGPGQPLDCSDMQFTVPGLSCVMFAPMGQPGIGFFTRGSDLVVDNDGYSIIGVDPGLALQGIELHRSADGGQTVEVFAHIERRINPGGFQDRVRFTHNADVQSGIFYVPYHLVFDPVRGRLLVSLVSYCSGACSGSYSEQRWMAAIEGFTTLYEVHQSFAPQAPLAFRVPVMPEGMAAADSFDTYWGPLTKPLDFTQAHSLKCDYPAAAPHVGDYLTVPDTVPTPAPGQGVYYVTSATYQGATRYGRRTTAGHQSGRDPALLPACMQP